MECHGVTKSASKVPRIVVESQGDLVGVALLARSTLTRRGSGAIVTCVVVLIWAVTPAAVR
eukprot:1286890-Rhodomonas_salina.2